MATKTRSEKEIRDLYRKIRDRVRRERHDGKTIAVGDGAWIEALRWVLGGCANAYHPPECAGDIGSCYEDN